jgi:hypothetical protein
MSDLESYVANKVINGHCDCMFLVNTYQWDWTTIAALVAPRPLLFANSDNDTIFPMDGNRRVMAKLRQVYKRYDKPDLVDEYVSKGGHEDRADLRVAAFGWMNRHLKNDTAPVKYEPFKQLPGKELRVFPEDKDVPKDALNGKIDETFVKRAEVKLPEAGKFKEWKEGMLKELREKSFRALPDPLPSAEFAPRSFPGVARITEPGIEIPTMVAKRESPGAGTDTVIFVGPDGFDRTFAMPDWAKPLVSEGAGWVVPPRGVYTPWTRKSPPNYVERSHALLGRTVDDGRLRDLIAVVKSLDAQFKGTTKFRVVGRGQAGIIAAYAALFEPSIKEVIVIDPPTSHKDGPIFLNVLRVLDIPEALGLLAPNVNLTLINAKDKAFDRTAQLYKLAGAEDKFERK